MNSDDFRAYKFLIRELILNAIDLFPYTTDLYIGSSIIKIRNPEIFVLIHNFRSIAFKIIELDKITKLLDYSLNIVVVNGKNY